MKMSQEPSMRAQILDRIEQSLTSERKAVPKSVFEYDVHAEKNREKQLKRKVIRKHIGDF